MSFEFQVRTDTDGVIQLVFAGELEKPEVGSSIKKVEAELSSHKAGSYNVVVDFRDVTGCTVFARSELVALQELLSAKARRTAYISTRPRFRGLALWVIHLAGDQNAKSVMSDEAIAHWFAGSEQRAAGLRERTMASVARLSVKGGE